MHRAITITITTTFPWRVAGSAATKHATTASHATAPDTSGCHHCKSPGHNGIRLLGLAACRDPPTRSPRTNCATWCRGTGSSTTSGTPEFTATSPEGFDGFGGIELRDEPKGRKSIAAWLLS